LKAEPTPYTGIHTYERGPTSSELSTWSKLIDEHQRALSALHICEAMMQNAIIIFKFAENHGVTIQTIPGELERRYLNVKQTLDTLTRAIRGAQDLSLGVRFRAGDVDILAPDLESARDQGFGAVVLIIAGVVVVGAAIAVAYWATKNALEISQQARAVIKKADQKLCADPRSSLCAQWKNEKQTTIFEKNETLADTIKSGVSRVGGGLLLGLIALVAVSYFWRKT
jgi:Flp pilus assembly pilin Flp